MTVPRGADPASCSRAGGVLRTSAAELAGLAHELSGSWRDQLHRRPDHADAPGHPAYHRGPTTPSAELPALATELAAELDRAGSALQVHAQELAENAAALDRIAARADAAGLVLHGWEILEPYGLTGADDARQRRLALPDLQRQVDRVAQRLGRSRSNLQRVLNEVTPRLTELTDAVRAQTGG